MEFSISAIKLIASVDLSQVTYYRMYAEQYSRKMIRCMEFGDPTTHIRFHRAVSVQL